MAYEAFTGEEYIDTDLVAKLNQDYDACGKLASKNTWSADNDFTAGLTVNKTPTVNADVSNKKYVDDSIAEGTVYRSKSTIIHPLQITKGNTIGQLKEAIVTLANKIKLLSQVTGCIGYFTCAETWVNNWTNDDFVLEEGQMWSVEIVSINSYREGYWVARITSYSEKSCYIVVYANLMWGNLHKYAFLTDVTSAVANLLSSNNTWTGSNVYNKNITVSNGTASGSEGIIDLGKPPTSKTKQPNIYNPGNGNLIINASENSIIALQSGDVIQWSVVSDETNTKTSAYLHSNLAATYTPSGGVVWEGNAKTATTATSAKSATKLATARTINGVSFDGTANITIADSTKLPIAGGTMTGDLTLKGNPTADLMAATKKYVDDSVASAGGGDVLAAGNNSFTGANTFQNLVTMVGGAVFTSRTTTLAWKNATQTVATINASTYTGNSATATKLATARTINGVSFDGTANITIADSTKLPIAGGTMTGDLTLKGNPTADLMAATKKYVDDSVASAGGGDVLAAGNNSFTGANTFQNLVTMVGGAVFTSRTTTLAWKNATQTVATINASTYTGNSATATKLATARTITANLASGTAGSFDGSANVTVGVTGTLPIANGGTGLTSAPSMLVNLASTTATSPLQASPRPGVTGTLPIANGGTGQTTAAGVRNALGLGNTTGAVPIANGGTGATTAAAARTALGCAPAYTYSTTDLTAGSSKLTTGTLYIVYE
jgi:hypothetical protein